MKIFINVGFILLLSQGCKSSSNGEETETFHSFEVDAVVAFDLAACPTGWSEFSDLKGRFVVGAGTGNSDIDGTLLTSRSYTSNGGWELTKGIPANVGVGSFDDPSPARNLTVNTVTMLSTTSDGSRMTGAVDANLPPFKIFKYCKMNSISDFPVSGLISTTIASCGSGWSEETTLKGRGILGQGNGNNDAGGAALTARVLGGIGGREYTTLGIPTDSNAGTIGDLNTPSSVLARDGAGEQYYSLTSTTTFSGSKADSNIPPFLTVTFCKSEVGVTGLPSGSIVAYDSATCPTGWSIHSNSKGRIHLGAGSGNTDAEALALTARALGLSGGREYTTGIPATVGDFSDTNPDSNYAFSSSFGASNFNTSALTGTFNGVKADSNMPPYFVLTYCQKI